MSRKSTIIIESNRYKKEIRYFWVNDNGTLSDLAEVDSPFSKAKSRYKEFSKAALTEIADKVIGTIDETYNKQNGLSIVVNGVKDDYIAVRNVIDKEFGDRHMDCRWDKRLESSRETAKSVRKIYSDLNRALSEYNDSQMIHLCDANDERGWLRFGFNRENIASESALYNMCGMAGSYLEKIMTEIRQEAESRSARVDTLSEELEKERQKGAEIKKATADTKLPETISRIAKEKKKEFGRQFEKLLDEPFMEKYLEEDRIAGRIQDAVHYVNEHPELWREAEHEMDFINDLLNENNRIKYIRKVITEYFNEDMRRYAAEINADGEDFWDKKVEDLKKEFLENVYGSDKMTEQQKEVIRQCVTGHRKTPVFQRILQADDRIEEGEFRWLKEMKETAMGKEYRQQLKKKLQAQKKAVLAGNDKNCDKWAEEWKRILKETEADAEAVLEHLQRGLKEYKAGRDKVIALQDCFLKGRRRIDAMISL